MGVVTKILFFPLLPLWK